MKSDPHSQRAVHAVMTLVLVIVKKQHISLVVYVQALQQHSQRMYMCTTAAAIACISIAALSEIRAGLMSIKVLIMLAHCIM